jgi:hypothetical protein
VKKALFLNLPSCQGFDGGEGARYWSTQQTRSFSYPKCFGQHAAIVSGICAVESSHDFLRRRCRTAYWAEELAVLQTNALAYPTHLRFALRIKEENPRWQPAL